jgi:hypothetical protein
MPEPVDVYADQFQLNTGPFGCSLNFLLSGPTPPAPGAAPQVQRQATVRTSLEHLKVMTFILHRQISQIEEQTGTEIPIPVQVLNALQIGLEDWNGFWRRAR